MLMRKKDFDELPDGSLFWDSYTGEYVRKKGNTIVFTDGETETIDERLYYDEKQKQYVDGIEPRWEIDGVILAQKTIDRDADYFTVQVEVDGIGNDTLTCFTARSIKECVDFIKKEDTEDSYAIIGQYFGEVYINHF